MQTFFPLLHNLVLKPSEQIKKFVNWNFCSFSPLSHLPCWAFLKVSPCSPYCWLRIAQAILSVVLLIYLKYQSILAWWPMHCFCRALDVRGKHLLLPTVAKTKREKKICQEFKFSFFLSIKLMKWEWKRKKHRKVGYLHTSKANLI